MQGEELPPLPLNLLIRLHQRLTFEDLKAATLQVQNDFVTINLHSISIGFVNLRVISIDMKGLLAIAN